jgi:hypothetical protein
MFRADFLPQPRNLEDGEMMNPTEPVRAAVCAYAPLAVGVGKPMRPSPSIIRQSSIRQVAILSFVLSSRTNT